VPRPVGTEPGTERRHGQVDGGLAPPSGHGLLGDKDAKLDAGRRIVAWGDGEIEAGAVENTGGHRYPKQMTLRLDAAAEASKAGFGPCFAATAAVVACAAHGHLERDHGALVRLAPRQPDHRPQRGGPLVDQKGAPHTIDGGSHRRKIDDDLIRKTARLWTTVGTTNGGHGSGAERTKGLTVHEQW